MSKLIVLDFDGVVVKGTNEAYLQCYADALKKAGVELDFDYVRTAIMKNWGKAPEIELAGVLENHPEALSRALEYYNSNIERHLLGAAQPIEGSLEAIQALKRQGRDVAIISGMGESTLNKFIDQFRLRTSLIAVVSTSGTINPQQQKSTGYHLNVLIKVNGLKPQEALCVGDSESDVLMANNAGVEIFIVTTGSLSLAQAKELGVQKVLPSLAHLPNEIRDRLVPRCFSFSP